MAQIPENEERIFEHYLEFSPKIRMMVIDGMEPDDRVRFTRCSKLSNQEAKASKNYIYELEFVYFGKRHLEIRVVHRRNEEFPEEECAFELVFTERLGTKRRRYHSSRPGASWEIKLDESTDLVKRAIEEFKILLQSYQRTIKKLSIHESSIYPGILENADFGIESLENLVDLRVFGNYPIQSIFEKLNRPLNILMVGGEKNSEFLKNSKELYQVQQILKCLDLELDNQQFLRLSAKQISIHVKNLTEMDIFKLIRSWQNGTIGQKFENCVWILDDSNFDQMKLRKLLRVKNVNLQTNWVEIKHFKKFGKSASVAEIHGALYFYT